MRLILSLILPLLIACAPSRRSEGAPTLASVSDAAQPILPFTGEEEAGRWAVRWHLLRAQEASASGLFVQAQQELDVALHILGALETTALEDALSQPLRTALENEYLHLLPHLEHFSPDSPLMLLLEGLSEERIEHLPADASQLVRIHQLSQRCDMPIDANARVAASIHFFQTRGKATFETWMNRSGRFRELILTLLREEGMPEDLLYLAMIESGFNPYAYSRAHAVGLWQFIESTGRSYGLRRNHWVDERRDPLKSTRAAARYLKTLHEEFQDWRLALAAYNAGRGRVARAITRAETRDFWQLELPRETRNYVPLFMAAIIIAKDPALFGFELGDPDPPYRFDEIALPSSLPYLDLNIAAQLLEVSYAALRELNPELRQRITPPQRAGTRGYSLRVPVGKGQGLLEQYARLSPGEKATVYEYIVHSRDNLSSIAQAFGVSTRLIAEANSLNNPNRIYPGQRLYIPSTAGVKTPAAAEQHTYTVRPGDSLSRIAQRHGVPVQSLMQWNGLTTTLIHSGKRLVIDNPAVRPSAAEAATAPARQRGENGGPQRHTIQPGETLWGLSRTFGASIAQLQQWNGLQGVLIRPGQQLIVRSPEDTVSDDRLYTVVRGDTLYSIARRFGLPAQDLARQNNISLSTVLLTGTTLKITSRSDE